MFLQIDTESRFIISIISLHFVYITINMMIEFTKSKKCLNFSEFFGAHVCTVLMLKANNLPGGGYVSEKNTPQFQVIAQIIINKWFHR